MCSISGVPLYATSSFEGSHFNKSKSSHAQLAFDSLAFMWLRDYENPCMHLNKTYLFGSNNSCSKVLNPAVFWMFLILEDELFWSTFCPKFEMRVLSLDEIFFYYWPMISRDRISSSLGYLFEGSRIIYFDHPYWLKASCCFSSVRIIYFQSVCILAQINIKELRTWAHML